MFERLHNETDRAPRCCVCQRLIEPGEAYISAQRQTICRDCSDRLELWEVLELLEICSIMELFDEKGKTGRR